MSKRYLTLIAVTAFSLSSVTDVSAQASPTNFLFSQDYHYNWDFNGAGARGMALGGAYTALSDEPLGLSWNPAGVVGLEEIYLSFDWSTFSPSGTYDFNSGAKQIGHSGGSNNFARNFVITAPTSVKNQAFTLGVAISRGMDTYTLFSDKLFPHPTSPLDVDLSEEREGYLNVAHLGGATKLSESIQFGATMNIHFGKVVVDQIRNEVYQNQLTNVAVTAHEVSRSLQQVDSFNLSGLNFTLGTIVQVSEDTRLGFTVETPFKMTMEDDVSIYNIVSINGIQDPLQRSDTLISADNSSQIEMPLILTLGLAHNWNEKFLTTLDLGYRAYSGSKFHRFARSEISPQGNEEIFREEIETEWENVKQVRFGGEYTVESKFGLVPLRFGFGLLEQPFRDVTDYLYLFSSTEGLFVNLVPTLPTPMLQTDDDGNPIFSLGQQDAVIRNNEDVDRFVISNGDQVTAYSLSLGFGLESEQRKLDFGYSYTTYTQSFTTLGALELTGAGGVGAYDPSSAVEPNDPANQRFVLRESESTVKDHRFMITFTGYF